MKYQQLYLFVVALLSAFVLAAPVPTFEDIERRWLNGESEKQIHAEHHIRDATPAWLVDREADADGSEFSYVTDRKTLEARRDALLGKREAGTGYKAMKKFVNDFMRKAGKGAPVAKRSAVDEAPVLKPKKMMRYYFSA